MEFISRIENSVCIKQQSVKLHFDALSINLIICVHFWQLFIAKTFGKY